MVWPLKIEVSGIHRKTRGCEQRPRRIRDAHSNLPHRSDESVSMNPIWAPSFTRRVSYANMSREEAVMWPLETLRLLHGVHQNHWGDFTACIRFPALALSINSSRSPPAAPRTLEGCRHAPQNVPGTHQFFCRKAPCAPDVADPARVQVFRLRNHF